MVFKNTDGKYYLGGVVSFGAGCARPGKYGVYARVTALRSWLDIYLPKVGMFILFKPLLSNLSNFDQFTLDV